MSEESGLAGLLDALRRRWGLVLLVALPIVVGAVAYAETLPDEFEGVAVVAFAPRPEVSVSAEIVRLRLPTYGVFIESEQVMGSVARDVGEPIDDIARSVEVAVPRDTGNIVITVTLGDPDLAARAANGLAEAAVAFSVEDELIAAELVSAAVPPRRPSGPPRRLIQAAALVVAVLAGMAAAVVVENLRPRVRTAEEIAEATGLPVVGQLPPSPAMSRRAIDALDNPNIGAHVRTLRTNLGRSARADNVRVVLVSSARSGEGKTSVATLFATSLALVDARVLLIDGDLLRPTVAARMGIPASPGLAELLRSDRGIAEVAQVDVVPNLAVIPTTADPEAGDLLVRRFTGVLAEARKAYDFVVIDGPPLLGSDASRTMATIADGVLLVVAAGSPVTDLRETVRALETLDAKVLGVVANRAAERADYAYTYTQSDT